MTNSKSQIKARQASKAKEFLDSHPALSASSYGEVTQCMAWGLTPTCKHGEWESGQNWITITKKTKGWEKFKDEFDTEEKKIEQTYDNPKDIARDKKWLSITKSYKEFYGEPWKFDHMVYWYEIDFVVFHGKLNAKEWMDYKAWQRYRGIRGEHASFEDVLINAARKVKKVFGDFSMWHDKMLSEAEVINHKKEKPFFFTPCKDYKGYSEMKSNSKYFSVHSDLINLRWLKWFVETDYCKKQWGNEFDWVKKKNLYPHG